MKKPLPEEIAFALGKPGKGVMAADESTGTITKRLAAIGVESTPETNNTYRDLLLTTDGLENFTSGVILFDETIRQSTLKTKTPYPEHLLNLGVFPGIKVDRGAKELTGSAGEKVTEGLDGLRKRFGEYHEFGAKFAKWRAVIRIDGDRLPTRNCLEVNAHAMARYAALAQEAGLVPICEPEVLMDGAHTIARSLEVTEAAIRTMYAALYSQGIVLERSVLKPNMVLSGYDCPDQADVQEVAHTTLRCLKRCVPSAVPSVLFLSGGQTEEQATIHLNAINGIKEPGIPWNLSFSFGRALQQSALHEWKGKEENVAAAQRALYQRAKSSAAATTGEYSR